MDATRDWAMFGVWSRSFTAFACSFASMRGLTIDSCAVEGGERIWISRNGPGGHLTSQLASAALRPLN